MAIAQIAQHLPDVGRWHRSRPSGRVVWWCCRCRPSSRGAPDGVAHGKRQDTWQHRCRTGLPDRARSGPPRKIACQRPFADPGLFRLQNSSAMGAFPVARTFSSPRAVDPSVRRAQSVTGEDGRGRTFAQQDSMRATASTAWSKSPRTVAYAVRIRFPSVHVPESESCSI